jgi:hypothetical protein
MMKKTSTICLRRFLDILLDLVYMESKSFWQKLLVMKCERDLREVF